MLKEPDRLRLKPWFDEGAGELTVLSAFCIAQFSSVGCGGEGIDLRVGDRRRLGSLLN